MSKRKSYAGIDYFRLIAAFLIIAIHTSPLASFSETGDFILTRVIARIAVPFFFTTSGFFLISRYTYNNEKLIAFIKKTALIYGTAILLYIPVNLYNGYFRMDYLLPNFVKDIVFDGTLYHLWYLPASVTGAVISWYLVKKLDYPKAMAVALLLYLMGLFGDSYYGVIEGVSYLKGCYALIFQVSGYTRNGIFFAPVFFISGGWFADSCCRISIRKSICGFGISAMLLFVEAMTLHFFRLQRHDSMYVFLLPGMYFLFPVILQFKGKCPAFIRKFSMILYIAHPMMIVIIRLAAKLLHQQDLLLKNSMVYYFVVCFLSVVSGMVVIVLWDAYRPEKAKHTAGNDRAYIEINLSHLEHNVRVLKQAMPQGCQLMAVVKAQAYGHGAFEIATHLDKIGVRAFAVATVDEGIALRNYGVRGEILILGYTDVNRAYELRKYGLIQTLIDFEYAKALNQQGIAVKVHIKIDTGMHRLGIESEAVSGVRQIFAMEKLQVCGMYTHLCCPDSLLPEDDAYTREQIDNFYRLLVRLKDFGIAIPKLHIQSSYGFLNYPGIHCNYVRAGIALYGVLSSPGGDTRLKPDLRPVLSLKSRVVLIRSVSRGSSVGYGRSFTAERDSRIAIIPVGYGDGFPRNLSCGRGSVLINQHRVPVIGRICMDQIAVDITGAEDVVVGSTAILIGAEGDDELSAPAVAAQSESISNELLCRLGTRLPVVVK